MADLHKYTSKEVLNKVLLDSSGDAVNAFSHTTSEALNAALDDTNSRLNVSLEGGTIGGDVTISGDLTVSGSNTYTYDEQVDGQVWIKDSTASSATQGGHLRLFSDDGAALGDTHRLGVLEFGAAEDTSSTITIGARIEAIADAAWSASENGADMVFYTTDGNASQSEVMRLTADNLVGIGTDAPNSLLELASTNPSITIQRNNHATSPAGGIKFTTSDDTLKLNIATNTLVASDAGCEFNFGASNKMFLHSGGNLGIGTDTPTHGKLEIVGASDAFQIVMSDVADADDTVKEVRMGMMHYKQAEEPVTLMFAQSGSSTNTIYIGGGTGAGNHATSVHIATAATYNSTSTTTNMVIDNNSRISLSNNDGSNTGNTIFGKSAWNNSSDNTSDYNTIFGEGVMGTGAVAGATNNVGVGYQALAGVTGGDGNTAAGYLAGTAITDGANNVCIGTNAGDSITTANKCTFVGRSAGAAVTVHNSNVSDGTVAVGNEALTALTSGEGNTAVGYKALEAEDDGDFNTAVGYQALTAQTGTSGTVGNTAVGYKAGVAVTSGIGNTALGYKAGLGIEVGAGNVVMGYSAMGNMYESGGNALNYNVAIGYEAMYGEGSAVCDETVAVGAYALKEITTGTGNVAVGYQCLNALTTGLYNTAVGYQALSTSVDGDSNSAFGYLALTNYEGADTQGNNSVFGYLAGQFVSTGENNTFLGSYAGLGDTSTRLTGSSNTAVGFNAGSTLQGAAANNTLLGRSAGDVIQAGTNNTCIGMNTDPSAHGGTNQTVVGYATTGVADDSVTLGNADVDAVYMASDSGAAIHCGQIVSANSAVDTTATYTALSNVHTKTAGSTNGDDSFYGLTSQFTFNDADAGFGSLFGLNVGATSSAASSGIEADNIRGAYIQAGMAGGTDTGNIFGADIVTDVNAGTVDSSVVGQNLSVDIESGCTIGTVYGLYLITDADTNPSGECTNIESATGTNADWGYTQYDGANSTYRVKISAAGQIDAEGTINASQSLDYAEYFESKDGKVIANGTSVKLDGNKIVACSDGDTPLGVIRPKSASCIVGGGQMFHWEGMFMKDDYGADIWESYTLTKWSEEITFEECSARGKDETGGSRGGKLTDSEVEGSDAIEAKDAVLDEDGNELEPAVEAVAAVPDTYFREHKYHSDRLPDGVTAPEDAETITPGNKRQKLNPDYDASKTYKSREERDEWHVVGLLGQIPVTKGQPTGSWIKMKDVSDTVEMYFVK